jgi:deoxyribodipyrimidine photo-lyase
MEKGLFWHRRDLRIHDNAGLFKALKSGKKIQPVFIFDTAILSTLPMNDQRVIFIHQEVNRLKKAYRDSGSDLLVYTGNPVELIPEIIREHSINHLFTNRDYEPYALERDAAILVKLQEMKVSFSGAKDHVIFEKNEVVKGDGLPYTVFTPYSKKWKEQLNAFYLSSYPTSKYLNQLHARKEESELPSLTQLGFNEHASLHFPESLFREEILANYQITRDIPSMQGTSRLSLHLRFGTISIRELARLALQTNEKFLNELIWRDFYQMILLHFPHTVNRAFRTEYDRIEWEHNDEHFQAWREGKTGYPLVDAGMRELNSTGHMHNRVRMVVASFLTKHLLLDWRLGERYFAEKLLDFELASNVGGWQWAAGCGCDAAPYFRVFNPTSQQEKFDPEWRYIKKWIPEFGTEHYPPPIIDHKWARERVLDRYKKALKRE